MQDKIIHLQRLQGEPLFLFPPGGGRFLVTDQAGEAPWSGLYGTEPKMESLTLCREHLFQLVDEGVHGWISEERFIPRFLAAAGAFTAVFFFMAYVLRDPIPFVDELVGSLVAGGAVYGLWGRRQYHSVLAQQKRLRARNRVNRVEFHHHPGLEAVERYLHQLEYHFSEDYARAFRAPPEELRQYPELLDALIQALENHLGRVDLRRHPRKLKRLAAPAAKEEDRARMVAWASSRGMDGPLFLLLGGLISLKREGSLE